MINKILKYFSSKHLLIIPLILSTAAILASCSQRKEINEDKFIKIYCDLLIMQDTTHSMNDKMRQEIFNRYSVTGDEYNSTIESYNSNPKKWDKFFDRAIEYLKELRKNKQGS